MTLTTDRLILRPYRESDFEAVHEYGSDPEVVRYTSFGPNTEEDTRSFLRRALEAAQEEPRLDYGFAIILQAENRLIGGCGLHRSGTHPRIAELGYVLHRNYWGRGYATEAARALLAFGFEELSLHRIFARCDPANVASARIMEKIGMQREGHLREAEWHKERWWDLLLYAILDYEWKRRT